MKGTSMKTRSVQWFVREIQARVKAEPTRPVLFDVTQKEADAFQAAFEKDGCGLVGRMQRHTLHMDEAKADAGLQRLAFFGPQCKQPSAKDSRPAPNHEAAVAIANRLAKTLSDDHVIQTVWKDGFVVETWKALDYIEDHARAWSGRELAQFMDQWGDGIMLRGVGTLAEKQVKTLTCLKANARDGGRATGPYGTDTRHKVEAAFRKYKRESKKPSAWHGASFLIREGNELGKFKSIEALWKLLGRMAKDAGFASQKAWFDGL